MFDLSSNDARSPGSVSADDAGLPILAGLVSYHQLTVLEEINHAIRISAQVTQNAYMAPATHFTAVGTESSRTDLPQWVLD